VIEGGHIVYITEGRHSAVVLMAYVAATCLTPMLSSWRALNFLGVLLLAGSAVTYALYWQAFVSVWCFFAAVASMIIVYHFEWMRRQHPSMAGP
jgi:hypothetical protein